MVTLGARGTQAVPASYKTPTRCLNNQWVTVNTMHEMVITFCQFKKIYNLLFNSRRKKLVLPSCQYKSCEYQFTLCEIQCLSQNQ